MKKDIITLRYENRCPYNVGDCVTCPIVDSRRSHGFPGVAKIIDVQKEVSRFDGKTTYYAILPCRRG